MSGKERGQGKVFRGTVRSDKMDKTVIVEVASRVKHPLYKKYVPYRKRFFAHDPKNECGVGDIVDISECRPISKNKTWRVLKIVRRAVKTE